MEQMILQACRPWDSPEAGTGLTENYAGEPQCNIDKCLYHCPFANGECVNCLTGGKSNCIGRPRKYDPTTLRELLKLRLTSEQICEKMGIGQSTLKKAKAKMREDIT